MHERFVLFDFDGVIADSFSATWGTARTYCSRRSEDDYRALFEGNIYDAQLDLDTGDHSACRHDLDWWAEFIDRFEREAKIFPGIVSAVKEIAHAHSLVIVSSSIESPMQGFLAKHEIESYFEAIMDHTVHKNKTEKIRMVFKKYGIDAKRCVFVTDTLGDVREASAAEIGCIAVSWGFHTHETLAKGSPFRIVDRPEELPSAISDFFALQKTYVSA